MKTVRSKSSSVTEPLRMKPPPFAGGFDEHYCPKTQNGHHTSSISLTYGHHGTEEGGYKCISVCVCLFFMGTMKGENSMYVRQVLNGISNGTQGMFMYLCAYVCACLYGWVFLLVCALHPWAMMAPFLIGAIIVGLSPGSTSWPLTPVKICQVNFLRICCDHRILSTSRQQALQFLK